jgi:hypothetical protein
MSFLSNDFELNQKIKGKVIASATSDLKTFAIKFEDGTGLLVEAAGDVQNPLINLRLVLEENMPLIGDAVCKVSWGWITASTIESASTVLGGIEFRLAPAGPLAVRTMVYQGSTFLSFMPYKGA